MQEQGDDLLAPEREGRNKSGGRQGGRKLERPHVPSLEKRLASKRGMLVSLHGAGDTPCSGVLGMSGLSVSQERTVPAGEAGKEHG